MCIRQVSRSKCNGMSLDNTLYMYAKWIEARVYNKRGKRVSNVPILCVECVRRVTCLEC